MKKRYILGGVIGFFLLLMIIGSMSSPSTDDTNQTPATPAAPLTYTSVTIAQLNGGSIDIGTGVKISGTVMQNQGNGMYLLRNGDMDIVMVSSTQNVYEGNTMTVKGVYMGPNTYTTTLGSSKTVPEVDEM